MAYLPIANSITVGGRVFTDLENLITLRGQVSSTGATNTSFRLGNGSSGYAPSGVNFRVLAYKIVADTTNNISLAYADNDLGIASATAPTNEVLLSNSANASLIQSTGSGTGLIQLETSFLVPNGKFVEARGSSATGNSVIILYGYEE